MEVDLRQWADSLRGDAEHDLITGVLLEVLDACALDEDRLKAGVTADIDELWRLKRAVRVASAVRDGLAETEWADMRGWRYMQSPKNDVQRFYSVVYALALRLGERVAYVERDTFPDLKALFDEERADYQRRFEEITTEEILNSPGMPNPVRRVELSSASAARIGTSTSGRVSRCLSADVMAGRPETPARRCYTRH